MGDQMKTEHIAQVAASAALGVSAFVIVPMASGLGLALTMLLILTATAGIAAVALVVAHLFAAPDRSLEFELMWDSEFDAESGIA